MRNYINFIVLLYIIGTNQGTKQNVYQIDDEYFVRDIDDQHRRLLGELTNRLTQHSDSASDEQIDTIDRRGISIDRYRNELLTDQLVNRDVSNNVREDDGKKNLDQINNGHFVRNLDQIGGGHLVRNLDQIGGGHLVRNLDQIGGGHLVRNLDQIGGGHFVRNLDQIGGGHLVRNLDQISGERLARNLDQIGGGHLVRNLDQIGGGHLVRNLDQIGGGNLVRNIDYSNAETKRNIDQSAVVPRKLQLARNRIRNDLLRNVEQIDSENLVRS